MFCKCWLYHLQFSKDFLNTQSLFLLWNKVITQNCQLESPEKEDREFLLDLRVTTPLRKKKKNHNSYKEGDLKLLEIHQKNAKITARK